MTSPCLHPSCSHQGRKKYDGYCKLHQQKSHKSSSKVSPQVKSPPARGMIVGECAICFCEMYEGNALNLSCGHVFHVRCYMRWEKRSCPLCRASLPDAISDQNLQHWQLDKLNKYDADRLSDEQLAQIIETLI